MRTPVRTCGSGEGQPERAEILIAGANRSDFARRSCWRPHCPERLRRYARRVVFLARLAFDGPCYGTRFGAYYADDARDAPEGRDHIALIDPHRLAELAAADDREFLMALLRYLDRPTPEEATLFRGDVLRRRTRAAIGELLRLADQHDRRGADEKTRAKWRAVRAAARDERAALQALPPIGAGPRRRALERIGQEYPEELARLRHGASSKNARRSLLERIASAHPVRMIELLREERARDAS